jgi:Mu-like prophage DNA circulation protein
MFESTVNSINSARDALGLKGAVSGVGSFRNIPFYILNEQKQSGGRRIVKREYPLRDAGGTNDLGRKLRERTFSACVLGKDAKKQSDALIDALESAGAGELVHPDFGTISVMVDSFDSHRNASELDYYEFTVTVYPAATDSAPESTQNTASAVASQKDSLFGSLGDTIKDAWQTIQEGTAGATAVLDAITGTIDDIYDAVENVGILQDVNSIMSSLTALKGSAEGLINAPAMLGANILGALSGLSDVCDASAAFRAYERLGIHLAKRKLSIDTSHIPDAAVSNINTLFYTASTAALVSKASAASGVLTQAIDSSTVAATSRPRAPELTADSGTTSSVASTITGSQLNAITPVNSTAGVVSSVSSTGETVYPLYESITEIEALSASLGEELDEAALSAADAGFITDSNAITRLRLLTVYDLRQRGLRLPGVTATTLTQTEPALVALYSLTGNSQQWQRFSRRNGISNPLFVPGGVELEVIDEQS